MQKLKNKQQSATKPSLLSGSNATVVANGGILARLEQGGKDRPIFKAMPGRSPVFAGSKWIMGMLGVVGVGAAIVAYQNSMPSLQNMDSPPVNLNARHTVSAPVAASEPQGLAALIVNEPAPVPAVPAPAIKDAVAQEVSPPVVAPPQTLALTSGDSSKTLRVAPAKTVQHATASSKSVASATAPRASATHRVEPRSKNNIASSTTQKSTKSSGAAPQVQAVDKDIALLAALMAYGAAQPARTAENTPRSAKKPPQPVQSASATTVKTKERNRDIVERQPADTTETLLQRCKQLGLFEGEFCHWRICSGRWDSDAACKVPQTSF